MSDTTWLKLSFVVDAEQVDSLSNILEVFLAQAVTSENAGKDEFYEVAFPGTPDWQKVTVTGLFAAGTELNPIIGFVNSQLTCDSSTEIPATIQALKDQDWERVWLDSFKPIQVGKDLWVCPSWCQPVEPTHRNIILDPGLAFGTGTHTTTNMCLSWLADQDLDRAKVLDYGSGSGILAIAAIFAGAIHADAVDIDPLAVEACNDNASRNQMADRVSAYLPHQLSSHAPVQEYELVIANILADVIIELRDTLLLHLKANGTLLLTGILESQAERVIGAFGSNFRIQKKVQEQWCLLICEHT